ncbi:MAG: lipocalin-like domain-containing protein [Pseudomonadota bacterium]
MNAKALCLILLPLPALSQGFAGLGTEAEGFAVPERGAEFDFPTDHGAHPEYRIEWWYLTATLRGEDGTEYGIQWTLFRSAQAPELPDLWGTEQVWMGHVGLTTPDHHFVAERLARGGTGQAGVDAEPFVAWIDDWEMRGLPGGTDAYDRLNLTARGAEFGYTLTLEAQGPLIFHGDAGYSVKSAQGQASYYYSQPFYQVAGTLALPDGDVAVTGQGWLDREWSSQPLSETQDGWDWISLSFVDGARLMGFRLRDRAGPDFTSGTWITPDGNAEALPDGAMTFTPLDNTDVAGRNVPTRWQIDLPRQNLSVTLDALNPEAWMATSFPYWEGPVSISGTHGGRGYLEMTGY